ncbi:MAG: phosphopyruvate hydratase, partial [bacterium]
MGLDTTIAKLHGRQVWDSRGRPTVEVDLWLSDGSLGRGVAPAGASRGSAEAVDLRDGGSALGGFGVRNALSLLNGEIAKNLQGKHFTNQAELDQELIELDGTPNKSRLGGNSLIATSLAFAQAQAAHQQQPLWQSLCTSTPAHLPLPEIQLFGGGAHAAGRIDIQDFMLIAVGAQTFGEALEWTAEVYRTAGELLRESGL